MPNSAGGSFNKNITGSTEDIAQFPGEMLKTDLIGILGNKCEFEYYQSRRKAKIAI